MKLKPEELQDIEALMQLMRDKQVLKLSLDLTDRNSEVDHRYLSVSVELSPTAFVATRQNLPDRESSSPDQEKNPDQEHSHLCKCGHLIDSEHNEAGCLLGCEYGLCAPVEEPEE